MIEPRPEDFGLNDFIVQKLAKRENTETKFLISFGFIIFVSAMVYFVIKQSPHDTGDYIAAFIGGFFFAAVIAVFVGIATFIVTMIISDSRKDKKNLVKYEKAVKEYKDWDRRNKENYWKSMNGFVYEREVSKLFLKKGYHVTTTKATGDGGVDIVLQRDGKIIIVQCKNTQKPAGPAIVRDLYGTMINFKAHEAILVTTSGCSKGAKEFMQGKPISVMSLAHLIEMNK